MCRCRTLQRPSTASSHSAPKWLYRNRRGSRRHWDLPRSGRQPDRTARTRLVTHRSSDSAPEPAGVSAPTRGLQSRHPESTRTIGVGRENLERVRLVDAVVQPYDHVVARAEREHLVERHRPRPLRRHHRDFSNRSPLRSACRVGTAARSHELLEPIDDRGAVRTVGVSSTSPRCGTDPYGVRGEQL